MYLITILDRTSKCPEAVLLSSITAGECVRALISGWITRFRVPAKITSNCGAHFMSSIWDVLCSLQNISCFRSTIFHPQYNGHVEPFHRSLKTSFHAWLAGLKIGLTTFTWSYPASFSTAETLHGAPLCLPGEFLDSDELPPSEFLNKIHSALRGLKLPPPHHQSPSSAGVPAALASADFVFVRKNASTRPLSQFY